MSLSEKLKSVKTGLAVLVAGAMITGIVYAKEIKNEGWPLPDDLRYTKVDEYNTEFYCKHDDGEVTVEVKVESYANLNGEGYCKYFFEDKLFMYTYLRPGEGHSFKMEILLDRDGNGSLETRYDLTKDEEYKEFNTEGWPEWVLDKSEESQKTETD